MVHSSLVFSRPVLHIAALVALLPVLTLGVLFATTGVASAHARYVGSVPAAGAVLTEAPSDVTITFAEIVNPTSSNIVVYDASMKQVSTGTAMTDVSDAKVMSVPIQSDGSEVYVVVWHTVSLADGDPDAGSFTFNIGASAAPTSNAPGTTATSSGGVPVWIVALVGILGLGIGGVGTALVLRRKPDVK